MFTSWTHEEAAADPQQKPHIINNPYDWLDVGFTNADIEAIIKGNINQWKFIPRYPFKITFYNFLLIIYNLHILFDNIKLYISIYIILRAYLDSFPLICAYFKIGKYHKLLYLYLYLLYASELCIFIDNIHIKEKIKISTKQISLSERETMS